MQRARKERGDPRVRLPVNKSLNLSAIVVALPESALCSGLQLAPIHTRQTPDAGAILAD